MLRIAVTGGIACGKSLAGDLLSARGVAVCDADSLAHSLVEDDSTVYQRIVEEFGVGVLDAERRIDRGALGRLVFTNGEARSRLNAIVHPGTRKMWEAWLVDREADRDIAAVLVPLLYEAGMADGWDAVVCVACSRTVQIRRLRARGLSDREAGLRIAAQMDLGAKIKIADYVIFNDGRQAMLEEQTVRVLGRILES